MAAQRALESAEPPAKRLFSDPLAWHFLTGRLRGLLRLRATRGLGGLAPLLFDAVAGPGPRASAVVRTKFIDDVVSAGVRDGCRQLVLFGAGFDTRGLRLSGLAETDVYELDHPATQAMKVRQLSLLVDTARVRYAPCDFERDAPCVALIDAGFDPRRASIIVWEGVSNYLTAPAVDGAFAALRRLVSVGSKVVFTYVDRRALKPEGAAYFPEAARWLRAVARAGEPWRFGLHPDEVPAFLRARGFELEADHSTFELGCDYFRERRRREHGSRLYRVTLCTRTSDAEDQRRVTVQYWAGSLLGPGLGAAARDGLRSGKPPRRWWLTRNEPGESAPTPTPSP